MQKFQTEEQILKNLFDNIQRFWHVVKGRSNDLTPSNLALSLRLDLFLNSLFLDSFEYFILELSRLFLLSGFRFHHRLTQAQNKDHRNRKNQPCVLSALHIMIFSYFPALQNLLNCV